MKPSKGKEAKRAMTNDPKHDLVDLLQASDLSADMQIIAEQCGMDVVKSLMMNCGGVSFYVPKPERMAQVLQRFIVMFDQLGGKLDEKGIKVLAVRLGISELHVKHAIRNINESRAASKGNARKGR